MLKIPNRMKYNLRRAAFVLFIYVFLFGYMGTKIIDEIRYINEQKNEVVELNKQVVEEEDYQEYIRVKINKLNDLQYLSKIIRDKYHLSQEGEIIFDIPSIKDN